MAVTVVVARAVMAGTEDGGKSGGSNGRDRRDGSNGGGGKGGTTEMAGIA